MDLLLEVVVEILGQVLFGMVGAILQEAVSDDDQAGHYLRRLGTS